MQKPQSGSMLGILLSNEREKNVVEDAVQHEGLPDHVGYCISL